MSILHRAELDGLLWESDWRTPGHGAGDSSFDRGAQIAAWLNTHPEVRSYRILDDSIQILSAQRPFLILCDPDNGLTAAGLAQLLNWAQQGRMSATD